MGHASMRSLLLTHELKGQVGHWKEAVKPLLDAPTHLGYARVPQCVFVRACMATHDPCFSVHVCACVGGMSMLVRNICVSLSISCPAREG